jgi:hypothetical protein
MSHLAASTISHIYEDIIMEVMLRIIKYGWCDAHKIFVGTLVQPDRKELAPSFTVAYINTKS